MFDSDDSLIRFVHRATTSSDFIPPRPLGVRFSKVGVDVGLGSGGRVGVGEDVSVIDGVDDEVGEEPE